jgi:glycosyltransferase involved in cell wall biosynthesis
MLLAKLRRAKLLVDLRDLWPDEVIAVGAADEGSLGIRALRLIERSMYRAADSVTCTTPAFMDTVAERGVGSEKRRLLPNGADVELFRPLPRENPIAAQYPFGDRFVVMYSGLLGIKHGLETIIDAAALLREHKEIVFFLRGEGPRREALEAQVRELGLENVLFGGERPIEDVPYLLARADVCVTNLLPDAYLRKIVSVKVFEYLACGKPVVGALAGEGARVLEESGGGIAVAPGDARAIADAVLELQASPERREAMGEAGRRFVVENHSRAAIAARLEELLTELTAGRNANGSSR